MLKLDIRIVGLLAVCSMTTGIFASPVFYRVCHLETKTVTKIKTVKVKSKPKPVKVEVRFIDRPCNVLPLTEITNNEPRLMDIPNLAQSFPSFGGNTKGQSWLVGNSNIELIPISISSRFQSFPVPIQNKPTTSDIIASPIPETGIWGMFIIGFGFTGKALRNQKKKEYQGSR